MAELGVAEEKVLICSNKNPDLLSAAPASSAVNVPLQLHSQSSASPSRVAHEHELLRTRSVHSPAPLPPVLQRSISDSHNVTAQGKHGVFHQQKLQTPSLHRSLSRSVAEELGSSPNSIHGFLPVATLGRGNKGTVVLALAKQSGTPFALKITRTSCPSMTVKKKLQFLQERSYREVEKDILSSLRPHPFLQTLHAHFEVGKQYSVLLLDFCSGGDLHTLRHKQPEKRFSETAARFYAAEVLVALEHLHSMDIVYRDLKPENILIQENGHIKLTDFDLSLKVVKPPNGKEEAGHLQKQAETSILAGVAPTEQAQVDASTAQSIRENSNPKLPLGYNRSEIPYSRRFGGCFLGSWNELDGGETDSTEDDGEASDSFHGGSGEEESEDAAEATGAGGLHYTYMKWRRRRLNRRNARKKRGDARAMSTMLMNGAKQAKKECICFVGTDEYVAPEVLKGEQHSTAMDFWSFGILLYELIYGSTPFKGKTSEETLYNIMEKEAEFGGLKSSAKHLIEKLLVKDPSKRLGVQEIKRHGFFEGLQWELLMDVARPPFIPPPYSIAELEEKAKRKQQRLMAMATTNSNYCWIDEVVGGSAPTYSNPSSSTHTQSSASSAFSLSSADSLHREDDLFSSQEWTNEMVRQQSLRRGPSLE